MKRKALLLVFSAVLAMAGPVKADQFLLGFTGFDYQDPNSNPSVYLDVGEGYKMVGFVSNPVGTLLDPYVDFSVYEYTVFVTDLTVTSRSTFSTLLSCNFTNGGRGSYYQDPIAGGTAAAYGINPPNLTAPAYFIDGSMRLSGSIDNFVLTFNFGTNQGNFSGDMTLDSGPDLIYVPPDQRQGWVLGGLAGRPNGTIPDGYDNQVSGECRIPDATPTTHHTWGAVKALYR